MPAGDKRDEAAERAERISDLRAFVDMLENEPSLPVPLTFTAAAYMPRVPASDLQSVEEVFAAAEKLGTEVRYNQREGRVETTWKRGCVSYTVYTRPRPELDRASDVVTITSPAQVLPTTAVLDEQMTSMGDAEPHSRMGGPS